MSGSVAAKPAPRSRCATAPIRLSEPKPIPAANTERVFAAAPARAARRARRRWPLGLALLALVLSGCGVFDREQPPPCPRAFPVADARALTRFNGPGRDLTDVIFEARIQDVALICDYDDGVIEADLRVRILVVDGPADRRRVVELSYFVAIATLDHRIVAREEFQLSIPFEGNRTRVLASDEVSPRIPLGPGQSGVDYVVYVGLALTPDELQYNRDNR